MVNDVNGHWLGIGVGDSDSPNTARNAPNWNAITLLTTKLHDKYQWARDLGVAPSSTYTRITAQAVEQFCQRTGLPIVRDPQGNAVANLAVRKRLGSYPPPAPILPMFFTVEGHSSDMWHGPVADTAAQLESEGVCRHQPVGYNDNAIPFDNASGVNELARLIGATRMDNGVPFPAGTPWALGIFSQGSIVGFDFYINYLAPGKPLEWRTPDLRGVLAYGNPCRQTDSIAPWAIGQVTKPGTHGLDPYKRFGLPGYPVKPNNWMDDYREGDIFAENADDKASAIKSAVYQAIARGDVFSNPYSLAMEILGMFGLLGGAAGIIGGLTGQGTALVNGPGLMVELIAIIQAIISGVVFLADQPNPHYSPYDISGGINWSRQILTAA